MRFILGVYVFWARIKPRPLLIKIAHETLQLQPRRGSAGAHFCGKFVIFCLCFTSQMEDGDENKRHAAALACLPSVRVLSWRRNADVLLHEKLRASQQDFSNVPKTLSVKM